MVRGEERETLAADFVLWTRRRRQSSRSSAPSKLFLSRIQSRWGRRKRIHFPTSAPAAPLHRRFRPPSSGIPQTAWFQPTWHCTHKTVSFPPPYSETELTAPSAPSQCQHLKRLISSLPLPAGKNDSQISATGLISLARSKQPTLTKTAPGKRSGTLKSALPQSPQKFRWITLPLSAMVSS